jgi:hypothetical protein
MQSTLGQALAVFGLGRFLGELILPTLASVGRR